ncbi:N-acetylmuramoyl-L-alanine amidase [Piscibacillus halophilus]|uniref:N-acetylmuramoyl-L-alanine amidase n=1 Tax=Piscibacillus halophilus TaxID=571933 RepID=A0A1H9MZJ3_9BACI|nr:N-acetylmuramoyl-L-alanine amidase [Piscibacillus halophilus]
MKDFQSYYGLKNHGIVDSVTLNKLNEVYNSPQLGKRSSDISNIKEKLNRVGFSGILVTDYFGDFTEKRVKEFQSYYGLLNNGIVDELTLTKLNKVYNSPFQYGKRHANTSNIKRKLNNLGYSGITVTDYFGSYTEAKLKEFQRDKGLIVNGIADDVTLNAIENSITKIFIDAGHGGHDPGAVALGLKEKDVVLDIVLAMGQYLSNNFYGVDVSYSRVTDEYIALEDRAKLANNEGSDYFISVHNNKFDGNANGLESYIHQNHSSETANKQKIIHDYLINKMGVRDRGKKKADFNVLRNTNMPAILVEYLFLDYPDENKKLQSSSYRNWLGQITAEAIASAFNLKSK